MLLNAITLRAGRTARASAARSRPCREASVGPSSAAVALLTPLAPRRRPSPRHGLWRRSRELEAARARLRQLELPRRGSGRPRAFSRGCTRSRARRARAPSSSSLRGARAPRACRSRRRLPSSTEASPRARRQAFRAVSLGRRRGALPEARDHASTAGSVGSALAERSPREPVSAALSAAGASRRSDLLERLERVNASGRPSARCRRRDHPALSLERYRAAARSASFRSGVVHGDLFRDNVLWKDGELVRAARLRERVPRALRVRRARVRSRPGVTRDAFDLDLAARARATATRRERPARAAREARAPRSRVRSACCASRPRASPISRCASRQGAKPVRDYRRFLARLSAIEAGALDPVFGGWGGVPSVRHTMTTARGGRLPGNVDAAMERLNTSVDVDSELWREDIQRLDRARARARAAPGVLTPRRGRDASCEGLEQIAPGDRARRVHLASRARRRAHEHRGAAGRAHRSARRQAPHRPLAQRSGRDRSPALCRRRGAARRRPRSRGSRSASSIAPSASSTC